MRLIRDHSRKIDEYFEKYRIEVDEMSEYDKLDEVEEDPVAVNKLLSKRDTTLSFLDIEDLACWCLMCKGSGKVDLKGAFLNILLKEDLWMTQPIPYRTHFYHS